LSSVKIAGIILFFLGFIAAILNNAYHILIFMISLLALVLLMFGFIKYISGQIDISFKAKKHTSYKDEDIPFELAVKNTGLLPISNIKICLSYRNEFSDEQGQVVFWASASGNSVETSEHFLKSSHLGNLTIQMREITIYDPIGLFKEKLNNSFKESVFIIPKCIEMNEKSRNLINDFSYKEKFSKIKSGRDSSEIFDIRQYREGDSLRQIHYKLLGKFEDIMVKEFSLAIQDQHILYVDFNIEKKDKDLLFKIDKMLTNVFSLSTALVDNKIIHSIVWYSFKNDRIKSVCIENYNQIIDTQIKIMGEEFYTGLSLGNCPNSDRVTYFSIDIEEKGEDTHGEYRS